MMKNYNRFILEKSNGFSVAVLDQIGKLKMEDIFMMRKITPLEGSEDFFMTENKDLSEYDDIESITQPNVREKVHVEIYCKINNEPKIFIITLKSFNEVRKNIGMMKEVAGKRIEVYQHLGLLYKKSELPSIKDKLFSRSDFKKSNENLLSKIEYFNDKNDTEKVEFSNEDFKLVYGSIKFKHFMEISRHKYNNRTAFEFKTILHDDKKDFLELLESQEEKITKELGIDFNKAKINTTDIFILDGNKSDMLKKLADKDYWVVSEDSRNITYENKNIDEGGVCYLLKTDDLNLVELSNKIKEKEKGGSSLVEKSLFNFQTKHIKEKIKEFGENAPKFIQVSLKKSKTGAQFGKITSTILSEFKYEDKILNENFFVDGFKWLKGKFNEIFKSFFPKMYEKVNKEINDDTQKIKTSILNKLNTNILRESNQVIEYNRPTYYLTGFVGSKNNDKELFLYVKDDVYKEQDEKRLRFLRNASNRIDSFLSNMTKTIGDMTGPKDLHFKFAEILTLSLMGRTNLPLFLVFGTGVEDDLSFTLHKYRTEKKEKHINNSLKHDKSSSPMYMAKITNYKDENGIIMYRQLNLYIFNYSAMTDKYLAINMRTNSGSHISFTAETKSPSDSEIVEILTEFEKEKRLKIQ